jgi:hypothetical protein
VYWYRHGFIVGGLVSVAFGVVLFARPFGLFSLIYGVSQIVMGTELRRIGQTLQPVLPNAA